MLNCHQVLSELSNYLDDDVSLELARALTQHLVRCHRCWVIYNTTSRTLEIVSDSMPVTVPIEVTERLHARLKKIYAGDSGGAGPQMAV
ncbi:MAG: zf-HC2 domain-containing protein [Acidobacteriales bacterium]|nr:zf-HC2 domain-containing protein [Terriglobales bacterium]